MTFIRCGFITLLAFTPVWAQVSEVRAPRQHGPIRDRTDHLDHTSTSTNWSGYAVTGNSFTSASGSWKVPTATCIGVSGAQYSSAWVGIDGFSSNTVEQIGTDSDCNGTTPIYYAWYEFYPKASYNIPAVPVYPGNVISASVAYANGIFTATIKNETTGTSSSITEAVRGAQRSSAEWIMEAPCCGRHNEMLPLADFGTAEFGMQFTGIYGTEGAIDKSASGEIGNFGTAYIQEIDKVGSTGSPQTSTCSSTLTDGVASFTCRWAGQ